MKTVVKTRKSKPIQFVGLSSVLFLAPISPIILLFVLLWLPQYDKKRNTDLELISNLVIQISSLNIKIVLITPWKNIQILKQRHFQNYSLLDNTFFLLKTPCLRFHKIDLMVNLLNSLSKWVFIHTKLYIYKCTDTTYTLFCYFF